jgi:hypothetical protein
MMHRLIIHAIATVFVVPLVYPTAERCLSAEKPRIAIGDREPSPTQAAVGEAVEGQALGVVSDKRVYAPGDRVVVGIRLVNVGRAEVSWVDCPVSGPRLTVSTPDGTPVPRTRRAMKASAESAIGTGHAVSSKLKPGESRDDQIDLALLYDLTVAGRYFVSAKRKVSKPNGEWSSVDAVSNKLEIIIDESLLSQTTGEFAARPYTIRIPRFADFNAHTPSIVYASIKTYEALVDDLVRQATEVRDSEGKRFIFDFLGGTHATAAIPMLLSQIDFDRTGLGRLGRHGDNLDAYPAEEALETIGIPAVGPIVDALGEEKDLTRRKLMVSVLRRVLGKDVAKLVLQKALESSVRDVHKRLEQAIDVLNASE